MPVIKFSPGDFLVVEDMLLRQGEVFAGKFRYFILRKANLTTFTAIKVIADKLAVDPLMIGYGGLKDEEGITEQFVSIPGDSVVFSTLERVNLGDGAWFELDSYGSGEDPITIGSLKGNSFKVCVRNLTFEVAQNLSTHGEFDFVFINYYDTQRFGTANGPKKSHLIGRKILESNWNDALELLKKSKSADGDCILGYKGTPADYFKIMDPRNVAFYCNAFESYTWNMKLINFLSKSFPGGCDFIIKNGIPYLYLRKNSLFPNSTLDFYDFPHKKYRWDGKNVISFRCHRPVFLCSKIKIFDILEDEHFKNRYKITLSFFLPSGCYATSVVDQIWTRFSCARDNFEY